MMSLLSIRTSVSRTTVVLQRAAAAMVGGVRNLNVHEYISMDLMETWGVETPAGFVASSPEEAEDIFMNRLNKRKCASSNLFTMTGWSKLTFSSLQLASG